jgi:hypothetical protein
VVGFQVLGSSLAVSGGVGAGVVVIFVISFLSNRLIECISLD